jgi:hypothetical protein
MRARSTSLLFALAAALPGCTLFLQDELDKVAATIGEEGEGEEGEGEEGEGEEGEGEEGEGEAGEGEGEGDDDDPACELEERLVVVRDGGSLTDVLQVYALEPGRFLRVRPEGVAGNLNLENSDNPDAPGITAFALGTNNRMYLTGGEFIYSIDRTDFSQKELAGRGALRIGSFARANTMHAVSGTLFAIGDTTYKIAEAAGVGETPAEVRLPDDYRRSAAFTITSGGRREDFIAMIGDAGYAVISSVDGADPVPTVTYDEDINPVRFNEYGGGSFLPRGIAFDSTTKKLLLGDFGRVVVIEAATGFAISPPESDFVFPGDTDAEVVAIAARGGSAWVLLGRGFENLFRLDLSTSPPEATQIATVDVSSFGRSLVAGCRRLVVSDFQTVFALDRETLAPITQLTIPDVEQISIVKRADLGLAGD